MGFPARDFESIYAEYSRMVYYVAYSVAKNSEDALDVSQNVFLRVIKHMAKLSRLGDKQLKSYLYRMTMNLCLDDKRRRSRELLSDDGHADIPDADESALPEAAALTKDQCERVRSAVDSLDDIYRETVLLHYFSGLNYAEIAELSGVSEGTVKSRMFRAKAKLCALLKEGELHG